MTYHICISGLNTDIIKINCLLRCLKFKVFSLFEGKYLSSPRPNFLSSSVDIVGVSVSI